MKKYNAGFLQIGAIVLVATFIATALLITKLKSTVSVQDTQAVTGCGGHYNPGEYQYGNNTRPVDNGRSECENAGCQWIPRGGNGLGQCRPFPDEPTPIPTPVPTLTPSPTPSPTPTKSPSPTPTKSPSPTPTRSPSPTPSRSPSPTPTPTMTPTATPNEESKLKICKYNDNDGNGKIDGSDSVLDWKFFYSYQDKQYDVSHNWWNIFNRGCVTVTVPSSQWVKVWEEDKSGWNRTNILSDGNSVGGSDFTYVSYTNTLKEVTFLNHYVVNATTTPSGTPSPVPSGNPNSCNGTCGSNYNCQSGLFCFQGYCRNPSCQTESSCGCPGATPTPVVPQVLSATAPPVLPKTGSNSVEIALSLTGLIGTGIFLFRKFRLV